MNTPGNSRRNRTVKRNANIYYKQMTLKATDNYVNIYLLCFMSLLYEFYSISAVMDDKNSLIWILFGVSPGVPSFNEMGVQHWIEEARASTWCIALF